MVNDIIAALINAVVSVPDGLAAAALAGVNPVEIGPWRVSSDPRRKMKRFGVSCAREIPCEVWRRVDIELARQGMPTHVLFTHETISGPTAPVDENENWPPL